MKSGEVGDNRTQGKRGWGPRSRRMMLGGLGGAIGVSLLGGRASAADASQTTAPPQTRFSLREAGIVDDGVIDYTNRINELYARAARVNATVYWDTTAGKGFVISGSGVHVPGGTRTVGSGCNLNRPNGTLDGAFLLPRDTSTGTLLTFGTLGKSSANPNGSYVQGLGFRGTTPSGANVPGMQGVVINDCSDVSVVDCVALDIDQLGTGGAFFWNASVNGRCFQSAVFRCGFGVKVDGDGATDGKLDNFQANACSVSISFGASGTGSGGNAWYVGPGTHLSGSSETSAHLLAGPQIKTTKCTGAYFDVAGGWQIDYQGIGLQCSNCFFLYGPGQGTDEAHCPINLANPEPYGPDSSIIGCRLNVDGDGVPYKSLAQGFVRLGTVTEPYSLIFEGNTVSAKGAPGPASWLGYVLDSTASSAPPAVVTGSTYGTRYFASANQAAWPSAT